MDSRKRAIEQLSGEITRLEQQITSECVEIGKRILASHPDSVGRVELQKYLRNAQTLMRASDDERNAIARLQELYRRRDELDSRIQDNERRLREITRDRESRLADLGAGAYALYRTLDDRNRYAPMFDEILKLDAEIEKLSSDLGSIEEQEKEKGFFEKLKLKTQKVILRGNISRVEKKKLKAYADSGGRVADSDFAGHATGELRGMFDFVTEKRRGIEVLHAENDRQRDELTEIRAELKRQGAEESLAPREKESQKRIEDMQKELEVIHCWIGQLYVEKDLRRDIPDEGVAAKFDIIGGMRESIRKRREQIHKLHAELELEELQGKNVALSARRKQLEEEMRIKERQIGVVDFETRAAERRMEELRRVLSGEIPYTDPSPLPPPPDFYAREPKGGDS